MEAHYGSGKTYINVTEIVKSLFRGSTLVIDQPYNQLFGDPTPGVPKYLKIQDPTLSKPINIPENVMVNDKIQDLVDKDYSKHKYYRIDLNLARFSGLNNQLIALAVGLVLGAETNRIIVVTGFYPDYNREDTVHINQVLDLDYVNDALPPNTALKDVRDLRPINWGLSVQYNLRDTLCLPLLIGQLKDEDYPYLDLGFTFQPCQFLSDPRLQRWYERILSHLKINPDLVLVKISCPYTAIHLRLEDDILDFISRTNPGFNEQQHVDQLINKYLDLIEPGELVYLATGLGKYPNRHNYVLERVYEKAKIIQLLPMKRGREFNAAADLELCRRATKFIGLYGSTFSMLTSMYLNRLGRKSILIS